MISCKFLHLIHLRRVDSSNSSIWTGSYPVAGLHGFVLIAQSSETFILQTRGSLMLFGKEFEDNKK